MYEIAVIGDSESILGFKALGFLVHGTVDTEEARGILHKLASENTAVIFLTEQLAQFLQADIRKYQDRISPAIILIPGAEGTLGMGLNQISTLVIKAVGMDILKKESSAMDNTDVHG